MTIDAPDSLETPIPPGRRRAATRNRRTASAALVLVIVVAVVAAVIWAEVAPRLQFLVTVVGPFPLTEATAGRVVDADAWFALLSIAVGLAAGVAALLVLTPASRWRAPAGVAITAVGLLVMFVVGQLVANSRLVWSWNPVAGDNHQVTGPLVLQAWGVLTFAPIAAVVIVLAASIVSDGGRRAR